MFYKMVNLPTDALTAPSTTVSTMRIFLPMRSHDHTPDSMDALQALNDIIDESTLTASIYS